MATHPGRIRGTSYPAALYISLRFANVGHIAD